jgi:hypothetical protein
MKRLLLASLLCVVAVIVAPVASSSAVEPVKCTFKGKTTFVNGHLHLTPGHSEYEFKSDGTPTNKCTVGTEEVAAEAEVKGEGELLSCTVSNGVEEVGVSGLKATFKGGKLKAGLKEEFKLTKFAFVGTGPVVTFAAEGHNLTQTFKAGGSANFLSTPTALAECESPEGLKEVGFDATSAGVVM